MIYEYKCTKCDKHFDVVKSVKDYDVTEYCTSCGEFAERQFSARIHLTGTKVTHAEYNPGLGCVVKNKAHKEYLCKAKGVVEIGNDYKTPDNQHKENEQKREERRRKRWEDA